ncbi:MAG: ABC transporter permease subunit [Chloroflexota bacterium]
MLTVFWKELADNFSSRRFIILFLLILLAGVFAIFTAATNIKEAVAQTTSSSFAAPGGIRFVFLKLFTISEEPLPSFLTFIVFFVPIVGIALGFDAINNEKNTGTLSRLISQPIFRDAVINGKFMAGVVTISIMLITIVLLVTGVGLMQIGVPPTSEEVIRLLVFLIVSILYGAFWLGLAMLFSIFFRQVATSALASIAIWIFFIFFIIIIAQAIANMVAPITEQSTLDAQIRNAEINMVVRRFSPIILFQEAISTLLSPGIQTLGFITETTEQWMMPTALSLSQSLLIVWPHLVTLVALTAVCFAISYTRFMREEIRST